MKRLLPTAVVLLCAAVIGCDTVYDVRPQVGAWQWTGAVKVRDGAIYQPSLMLADGTVKRLSFCSNYPIIGLRDGSVVNIHYREVKRYPTIDDPCVEFDQYKVLQDAPE